MQRIIIGGTGFIGQALVKSWLAQNIKVTVVGRSKKKIKKIFGHQVNPMIWRRFTEIPIYQLKLTECIVNLAGVNIGTKKWSKERKKKILESRLRTTHHLIKMLIPLGDQAPRLLNASAIGIYDPEPGQPNALPQAVDEETPIDFNHYTNFPTEVARRWELVTFEGKAHGIHIVNLRFGMVLGKNGGMLKKLLPSFKFGLGAKLGTGHQPLAWIHMHDLIAAINFLLEHPEIHSAVNIVSPNTVTQHQFANTLAKVLHRKALLSIPAFVIKAIFGEMGNYLLLQGQHVYPKKLVQYDFRFQYPELEEALKEIL